MAHDLRVFLDASALIAAGASPLGGSALVAQVCARGLTQALVTRRVLLEAERNLDAKFPPTALLEFYNLLGRLNPQIVPPPAPAEVQAATLIVPSEDAHVLAATRTGRATHLLTSDRSHFLGQAAREAILPIVIRTPGGFLSACLGRS